MGGKELAPLYLYFEGERGSNTFAADPPDALDLREFGAVGVAFLWLLSLATTKKVTSRRATPGQRSAVREGLTTKRASRLACTGLLRIARNDS